MCMYIAHWMIIYIVCVCVCVFVLFTIYYIWNFYQDLCMDNTKLHTMSIDN